MLLQRCAVWTALILTSLLSNVGGSGVFQLRLRGFENALGVTSAGGCCSGRQSPRGQCSRAACRTKFRVCLMHYQRVIADRPACTFGERTTPVLGGNSFQVDQNGNQTFVNPIEFRFNFSWPGTYSLVIEAWHEKRDADPAATFEDRHVLVHRMTKQGWLDVGSDWTRDERRTQQHAVFFDYRVQCDKHYYGAKCNNLCKRSDDRFGHYECREDGTRQCHEGWTGAYCTVVASCLPGCHREHGFCEQPNECKCRSGWEGKFCDVCTRYPGCKNGTCSSAWGCDCLEGWGGLFCDEDLNYCTNKTPCKNGATCYNTGPAGYTCECAVGFAGAECEIEEGGCGRHPCLNGGTCRDTGHNFTCVCPRGWSGHRCETAAETCSDSPCQNGGRCVDQPVGYHCVCERGFKGTNCEQKHIFCQPDMCQNGGSCVNERDGYRCLCPLGFAGEKCEQNVNECAGNPCRNGGTCHDLVNDYNCVCQPGFVGSVCEMNVNDCLTNPCANGGTCHDLINDYHCTCRPGFSGRDCSVDVDECAGQFCQNGGVCIDRVNDYECRCPQGFVGEHCQFEGVVPAWARSVAGRDVASPIAIDSTAMSSEQVVLISTLSVLVPALVLVSIAAILCMKYRRRRAAEHADDEARRQNAENASTGKRQFEENMIVNALDFPSGKVKNIEDSGLASYGVERAHAQKQLNIDPARRMSALLNTSSSSALDKVDFESACRATSPPVKLCVDSGGGPSYGDAAAGANPCARVNPNRTNGVYVIDEHSRGHAIGGSDQCDEGLYATEV